MTHIPDPAASRALLVGVSQYDRMAADRQLPTVEAGVNRLAELLRDERVWGLPEKNCRVLHQPADADAVVGALRAAAEEARGALLFYYAGHGLADPALPGGELNLALPHAYEPGGTHLALSYAHVRREFNVVARSALRVAILDCCWSGLAACGGMGDNDLGRVAAIEGTAVLTATTSSRIALAPPDEQYPAFTGALLDALDLGLEGEPRMLDLGILFQHLSLRLAGEGRPQPQLSGSGVGAQIPFIRNVAWRERASRIHGDMDEQVLALRRAGHYGEANNLQRQAAESGQPVALKNVVTELRRIGRYGDAADLECSDLSCSDLPFTAGR